MFSIVLCIFGRVFAYVMYDKNAPDIYRVIAGPTFVFSLICGLLAILAGRSVHRQNKKLGEDRKDKAAQTGIILGALAFIPVCLSICGFLLLALATGYQP